MMGMGMGGCGAGAYDEANWQAPMREQAPGVPILQDEQGVDAWSAFGGGHDDLFVYDRNGRLFAHLCSAHLCSPQPVRTDLDDPLGFESVRRPSCSRAARARAAAAAAAAARGSAVRRRRPPPPPPPARRLARRDERAAQRARAPPAAAAAARTMTSSSCGTS